LTGDIDPLLDDSIFFFHRLQQSGVRCALKIFRGLPHGYLNLPSQLDRARTAIDYHARYLTWLVKMDDTQRRTARLASSPSYSPPPTSTTATCNEQAADHK
jgi:acetyl esterase/lipase